MSSPQQTVFIVEDDAAVRDSLALLLGLEGHRVQAFGCAEDFLRVYQHAWTGCLLLDVRMPGMSGLELQAVLQEKQVMLPIIIITAHGDVPTVRTALKSGAVDFIEKPVDPDLLVAAVSSALDADTARRQVSQAQEISEQRLRTLTARERQVLDLVGAGSHNREVAAALGISPRTVEVHKSRVMEKLQVRNVSELVRIVLGSTGKR